MTHSDAHHLQAAQGWLELGMLNEAFAELDNIAPENSAHPLVLKVRWSIYHAAKKWTEAAEVAHGLTQIAPDDFDGWWMRSFALHELERTQEAYENLVGVVKRFKGEGMAHYNLACYLTRLGRLDEARASLKIAFALEPKKRAVALQDADLEPLWAEIQRGK